MRQDPSAVQRHYHQAGLSARLLAALESAGKDPDALTRDDLAPFDEFHTFGREATRDLARRAGFGPGMEILDVGSGIGGPARTLAGEFGCRVTGLDLVDEYCRAAAELSRRVDLGALLEFRQGDATALPFPAERFDGALMEHASMNIADKRLLFGEIHRVLRPGACLALHEICAGAQSPPHFPVPWAEEASISFLIPPEELRARAEEAGLALHDVRDVSPAALEWFRKSAAAIAARGEGGPPPLGLHLLMGPTFPLKIRNLVRNLEEDRIRVVQMLGARPAAG